MHRHVVKDLLAREDQHRTGRDHQRVEDPQHHLLATMKLICTFACHDAVFGSLYVEVDHLVGGEGDVVLDVLADVQALVEELLLLGQEVHQLDLEVLVNW